MGSPTGQRLPLAEQTVKSPPTYSVLLTSRNEGERLKKTVDSVRQHAPDEPMEIVIVDDHSDDDSTCFLRSIDYAGEAIRAVHNHAHRGLIYSRAQAADLARGKYLVFLDAHCAVTPHWLESLSAELATIDDRGLVTPTICRLNHDWAIDLSAGGAAGCTVSNPFFDFSWAKPIRIDGKACTCTIGGGAWMCAAEWYRYIGGLDRNMLIWGLENIDIPLRTWVAGGWCLAAEHVKIGHLFNDKPLLMLSHVDYLYNKIRAVHNVFTGETFRRAMEAMACLAGFQQAMARVFNEREELAPFKDRFESIRKRSDAWLIDTFRIPLREAPSYHLAPRRRPPEGPFVVPRPSVSVIVLGGCNGERLQALLSSLLAVTTYGNFDVQLVLEQQPGESPSSAAAHSWHDHPRIRVASCTGTENPWHEGVKASEADFVAFLPEDTETVAAHWIEQFLLLAERRPRMLLACPRTIRHHTLDEELSTVDCFESVWDWDASGFLSERTEKPLSPFPYHAIACPDTLLFWNRQAYLALGGLDSTVNGLLGVADLAIQGWLCGFEVFCHPGISVHLGCRRQEAIETSSTRDRSLREYAQMLPAAKYFSPSRRGQCEERCPHASALVQQNVQHLAACRSEFRKRARFDDDWLFYKFNVESPT